MFSMCTTNTYLDASRCSCRQLLTLVFPLLTFSYHFLFLCSQYLLPTSLYHFNIVTYESKKGKMYIWKYDSAYEHICITAYNLSDAVLGARI